MNIYKILVGIAMAVMLNCLNRNIIKEFSVTNKNNQKLSLALVFIITIQVVIVYKPNSALIDISLAKCIWFLATLNYIAFIDYKKRIIPNRLILQQIFGLAILYCMQILIEGFQLIDFNNVIITLLLTGGSFFIVYILTKGALGAGDVKLMVVLGLSLTQYNALTTMFYALIICTATGMILMISKRKKLKDELPFAPFILIGTIMTLIPSA